MAVYSTAAKAILVSVFVAMAAYSQSATAHRQKPSPEPTSGYAWNAIVAKDAGCAEDLAKFSLSTSGVERRKRLLDLVQYDCVRVPSGPHLFSGKVIATRVVGGAKMRLVEMVFDRKDEKRVVLCEPSLDCGDMAYEKCIELRGWILDSAFYPTLNSRAFLNAVLLAGLPSHGGPSLTDPDTPYCVY